MKYLSFLISIFLITGYVYADDSPWTKVYKHLPTPAQTVHKQELTFEQRTIPFTQLIFSWNAHRPQEGYYDFFLRVRDHKTKKWQDWHKIVSWGANIQKSFFSRVNGSRFDYARFEMDGTHRGDAYQLKVVAYDANLADVKALVVTAADFFAFMPELYSQRGKTKDGKILSSFMLHGVPKKSQMVVEHPRAHALCSPTSMSMMVESLTQEHTDTLTFANNVYDHGLQVFGNWPFNTAHAFEHCEGKVLFYVARLNSFADLYQLLRNNIPIAVSVRGTLKDGKKPYNNGHLMLVIGWDAENKKVLCYDPAFDDVDQVAVAYDIHDFVRTWECSRRLIYKPEVLV